MPDLDPDDPNCPLFYEVREQFAPKFIKSPWAAEMLEIPTPGSITGQIDMLRRQLATTGDTQMMPVIEP